MLLKDKVSVVYGAGGAIGGAVARTFAREGAKVYLTGRRLETVGVVARRIFFPLSVPRGDRLRQLRKALLMNALEPASIDAGLVGGMGPL